VIRVHSASIGLRKKYASLLPRVSLLTYNMIWSVISVASHRYNSHSSSPQYPFTYAVHMTLSIPSLVLACIALLQPSSTAPISQTRSEFGPHITTDFPDPSLLRVGDIWYAFAGQSLYDYTSTHIQIATSIDFKTWTLQPANDMLPVLPGWVDASNNHVWAPDINHLACVPESDLPFAF
jgi:hypothetical protein